MINIKSLDNLSIKRLLKLRKSRNRKIENSFIVDGVREIKEVKESSWKINTLFYCPELDKNNNNNELLSSLSKKTIILSENVFRKVCYKENPDGFLAEVKTRERSLEEIVLNNKPLIIVLDGVEKPGNLGAILRTAAASGVTAIIINNSQTDIYNPNVIRASEGQFFKQNIVVSTVNKTVKWLKTNNIISLAAVTNAQEKYTEVDFNKGLAIILGSEAKGLSQEWLEVADKKIRIDIKAEIDSLNVSVAAAIILFEALRQRKL